MASKSHPTEPSNQPGPSSDNTIYRFIDGKNPDSTVVKRHVMRNYIRKTRRGDSQTNRRNESTHKDSSSQQARRMRKRNRAARSLYPTARTQKSTSGGASGRSPVPTFDTSLTSRPKATDPTFSNPSGIDSVEHSWGLGDVETIEQSSETGSGSFILINPTPQAHQGSDGDNQRDVVVRFSRGNINYSGNSDNSFGTSPFPASSSSLSPSPQTVLSAAWRDPFRSLPMKLTEREEQLFHFYVKFMPACSYGFNVLPPKAHNWYNDVFVPEAMKGAICFQNTILVHAASTQAWVCGLHETPESIAHRAKGVKALLRQRANYPNDFSDAVISATLSAAAAEDFDRREERKKMSWWHMRGAMEMIRRRGGPAAFRYNRRMAMLINWSDYIFSGYSTHAQFSSFLFEPETSVSSTSSPATLSPSPSLPFNPMKEIESQCEAFIGFLYRSERLAVNHRTSQVGRPTSRRMASFEPHTLLFKILSSPPAARYSIPGERKQIISRLAALMMINAALWDYRLLPKQSDRFLKGLSMKLIQKEVDLNESVEALLQILLAYDDTFAIPELEQEEDDDNDDDHIVLDRETGQSLTVRQVKAGIDPYERPWFVGRMIKIAKRLGLTSWMRLNEMLFSFLTLRAVAPRVEVWEESLRKEILTAPLTMYIMPVSQPQGKNL
ncbi:hypothetical protein PRK78_000673 [Emydomyces testavorans]|uniref:Sigma-70 region 2 family protein n=1 Tax=Emydomyces testavorans TaxID=2070801 RepID=A0AAF0IHV1_9EURO|nr:hypothetical protein PRK78_000673 [Emydomyces testavorans]